MRDKMNSNQYQILFYSKSQLDAQSAIYFCSHELRRNETHTGMDYISVILTKMKFHFG